MKSFLSLRIFANSKCKMNLPYKNMQTKIAKKHAKTIQKPKTNFPQCLPGTHSHNSKMSFHDPAQVIYRRSCEHPGEILSTKILPCLRRVCMKTLVGGSCAVLVSRSCKILSSPLWMIHREILLQSSFKILKMLCIDA